MTGFLNGLKQLSLLLLAVLAVFLPSLARGQALDAATSKDAANILKKVEYLQDPTGRMSFRDVLRPAAEKAFKPYRFPALSSADEAAVHWFRFDVEADRSGALDAVVYFTDMNVTTMHLYRQVVGANADVFRYDPRNNVDNTVSTQFGVGLPATVEAGQRRTLYVSIRGSKISGRLELWQRDALDSHLGFRAALRIVLLVALGATILVAGAAVWRRGRLAWLTLPFAALVYAGYYWITTSAFLNPSFFGSLDVPFFLMAVFGSSAAFFCAGMLRRELVAQHISWWSLLLGCALVASTLMGIILPGPALLFSYVLVAALCGVCLFIAFALITFKNAYAFQLKALLAVLFAASIALMPQWPIDLSFLGDFPSFLITGTLLFAAVLCFFSPADTKQIAVDVTRAAPDTDFYDAPPPAAQAEAVDIDSQEPADMAATFAAQTRRGGAEIEPDAPPQHDQQTEDGVDDGYGAMLARAQAGKRTSALPIAPAAAVLETDNLPTAIDELTGVFTDATILAIGEKTLAQTKRYNRNHTVIMLRIEDYGDMQQTLGQPTSDRAAKLMAVTSMRELRESDVLGRLKEDTFLALLPETDFSGAVKGLERTQANIIERTLPTRAGMKRLNVVFSATSLRETDADFQTVIDRLEAGLINDVSGVKDAYTQSNVEAAE